MGRLWLISLALATLPGCETIGRKFNPSIVEVIQDGDRKAVAASVATTAERRVVLVKLQNGEGKGQFCAEPSPDAIESVAGSIATALQAKSGLAQGPEAGASLGGSVSSAVAKLSKRTQGLVLYRDGLFALCQAHLNGAIDKSEYLARSAALLEVAHKLIEQEIRETNGAIGPKVEVQAATPGVGAITIPGGSGALTGGTQPKNPSDPGTPPAPPALPPASLVGVASEAAQAAGAATAVKAAMEVRPTLSEKEVSLLETAGGAIASEATRKKLLESPSSVADAVKAGTKAAESFGKNALQPEKK